MAYSAPGETAFYALTGIPFAVAGGIVALYVTGLDFSISAAIGFVSFFGVSVMDGILMITYYNVAISTGIGSQVQRPLATVVVGGMLIGPIMLLLVVPALRMLLLGEGIEPKSKIPENTRA